jgi:prepilin-type N-terminal cleavage/methylation domain-containing protein
MFQPNSDLRASDLFRISRFGIRLSRRRRAFTLIEMLVVIGIVVLLVALLVPAGAIAISTARDAAMSLEISNLETAIQSYTKEKGDLPPSMGELDLNDLDGDGNITESLYLVAPFTSVCERHLRKCFPKMTIEEKRNFYNQVAPRLNPAEAIFFWLTQTQNDERNPFFSTSKNFKIYYDFKQERIIETEYFTWVDNNVTPSRSYEFKTFGYKPAYAKDTGFIYFDARTYVHHALASTAAAGVAQPYGDFARAQEVKANGPKIQAMTVRQRMEYQYMNPTTFQILTAGQDGEWGPVSNQFNSNGYPIEDMTTQPHLGLRQFKEGIVYNDEDKDNLTNFSEGKRLGNHIP